MAKQNRATTIEKEKRIFQIQAWIIEGVQDRLIVKNAITAFGIDARQAQRYVKEAYVNWKKIEGVNIEMKREMKIAQLEQIKRSLKDQYKGTPAGISAIMAVEKELIKLQGLEPTKAIDLNVSNLSAIEFKVVYGNKDN